MKDRPRQRAAQHFRELEQFELLCRRHGLSMTVQRRVILEALVGREDHPTTDLIFAEVRERLPGLSRTTVYRALETLVQVGAARKVCHPGSATRFEVKMSRHHHLVCLRCEKVVDLEDPRLDGIPLPAGRRRVTAREEAARRRSEARDRARRGSTFSWRISIPGNCKTGAIRTTLRPARNLFVWRCYGRHRNGTLAAR